MYDYKYNLHVLIVVQTDAKYVQNQITSLLRKSLLLQYYIYTFWVKTLMRTSIFGILVYYKKVKLTKPIMAMGKTAESIFKSEVKNKIIIKS